MADFIQKFNNLDGITLAEQQKNLYKLLNSKNYDKNQDNIVKNLQPKNRLQKQFYVDVLIYFRRIPELLEIFNDGDERFVCKLLKHDWFILEVFQNVETEKFVNECLPEYSYSTRMKFLNKLSAKLAAEKTNDLYDCLLKKYGLFVAQQFLVNCSVEKINEELTKNDLKLSGGQLRKLYFKEPNLLVTYIEKYNKSNENFKDKKFLKFIAEKDWNFCVKLIERFKLETTFGKRTTRKVVKTAKEKVLQDSIFYSKFLKKDVVSRKLQRDFRQFYLNLFPSDFDTFKDFELSNRFLKYAPPKIKFKIFSTTFLKVYKERLEDHTDIFFNEAVMDMMRSESPELCDKWATKKYEETKDVKYVKYMTGEKVLDIFKRRFCKLRNKGQRTKLLDQIADYCKYNNDLKILEEVFQFLCEKINIIDSHTIDSFFFRLYLNELDKKLNKKLWTHYMFLCENKQEYWKCKMVFKYLEFLFKNELPLGNSVQNYIELTLFGPSLYFYEFSGVNPDFVRFVLLEMIRKCSEIDDEEFGEKILKVLNEVLKFNHENPEKSIDIYQYPKILGFLMKPIRSPYLLPEVLRRILCKKNRNEVDEKILDCYFKYHKCGRALIVPWFFENDPKFFAKNFDLFLELPLADCDFQIWGRFNFMKFSPVNLDGKLLDFLLLKFKDDNINPADKVKYVGLLAQLLPSEDFVGLTKDLVPKSDRINLENKEEVDLCKLQCEVAKAYKKCSSMKIVKNVVLKFCTGDFLQPASSSLYSVAHRIPEKDLTEIIRNIQGGAVSVRKHAFFLACMTMDNKFIVELFKEFATKEDNVSVQKYLFSSAVKYFIKNPSEETWSLVKIFIDFIEKSDKEALTKLIEYKIPLQYKQLYWELVWQFLNKNKDEIPDTYLNTHLSNAKDLIKTFNSDFCETIIKMYLQKIDDLEGILRFTTMYLLHHPDEKTFNRIFPIIQKNQQHTFFNEFISHYKEDYFTKNTIDLFFNEWCKIFTPVESFKEYVILKTLQNYNQNSKIFAQNLANTILETIETYSPIIIEKLGEYIYYTITEICDNRNKFVNLLKELMENQQIAGLSLLLYQKLTEKERKKCSFMDLSPVDNEILFILSEVNEENDQVEDWGDPSITPQ